MSSRLRNVITLSVALFAVLIAFTMPLAPAQAHALPIAYDPAPNAALAAPPSQVHITFSEQINPDISKIVVVNPSNQEVDNHDSHVDADGVSMTVTLPLLAAGTYVVAWRTHSADDGHVAGGSYIFHVERADGTVPPLTGALPSGNIIGGGGVAVSPINGPVLLQTIAHWLALLALTLLLGIIFWWSFVIPRQTHVSAELGTTINTRLAQMADLALEAILGGTILEVLLQAMILDGSVRGIVSWPYLASILFHSRQGIFLLLRLILSGAGLACLWTPRLRTALRTENLRRVLPVVGVLFALGFVYSGHGGSSAQWWGPINDLLHLLANGIWVGGLLTLATVVLPALLQHGPQERLAYFARSIPAFSLPALVSVAFVALTGPLNADTRMTSFSQLWTTPYGIVLTIKIALFLIMVAVSYLHAFQVRPQLATATGHAAAAPPATSVGQWLQQHFLAVLAPLAPTPDGTALAAVVTNTLPRSAQPQAQQATKLSDQMTRLIRLEALFGVGVLFCAALLAPLAGTLTPTVTTSTSYGVTGGSQTLTQTVDSLKVTLAITPGKFGSNQVTLTIKNPDGTPASGGTVFVLTEMKEMDMGINTFDFTASTTPGAYVGQVDLPMAGHWFITAKIRTKADPNTLHSTEFTVGVGF
jgi:copper transport protein